MNAGPEKLSKAQLKNRIPRSRGRRSTDDAQTDDDDESDEIFFIMVSRKRISSTVAKVNVYMMIHANLIKTFH